MGALDVAQVHGPVLSERSVRVEGWAFDPQAAIGSGLTAVHVWASRVRDRGADPSYFLGAADFDQARPDLARTQPQAPPHAGFALTSSLPPGTYLLTAYAWNERTARWEDARSVQVVIR